MQFTIPDEPTDKTDAYDADLHRASAFPWQNQREIYHSEKDIKMT